MIVVRVKVSRGIEPLSPMGINSADTTVVNRSMGRYSHGQITSTFKLTQPGMAVVPLHISIEALRFIFKVTTKTIMKTLDLEINN